MLIWKSAITKNYTGEVLGSNGMEKTRKRNITFALLFVVGILAFFVLIDIQEIMDYSKIKAAGNKTLVPVNIKQETTKRHYKKRTTKTTTNYVQFVVEINNKEKLFWMKTSEAYGENSPSAGINAVSSKKKIERYIFYTDDNIYYSKKAATTSEYIRESIGKKIFVFLFMVGILGAILLVANIPDLFVKKRGIKANS